uniref:SFRICE_040967 n=1 Tax=Spodoptera frugiperda TaxID=7108 RepID=A0A2H1W6T8_SPOFR
MTVDEANEVPRNDLDDALTELSIIGYANLIMDNIWYSNTMAYQHTTHKMFGIISIYAFVSGSGVAADT